MKREHLFSPNRKYRYALWREWDLDLLTGCADDAEHAGEFLMVVGLNPSTADEKKDDPTLRRCIDFAKRWGFEALCMTNLFAWRATKPRELLKIADPVGPENDITLIKVAKEAGMILCAWGGEGKLGGRATVVTNMLAAPYAGGKDLMALRLIKDGSPEHPLYMPAETKPITFKVGHNAIVEATTA